MPPGMPCLRYPITPEQLFTPAIVSDNTRQVGQPVLPIVQRRMPMTRFSPVNFPAVILCAGKSAEQVYLKTVVILILGVTLGWLLHSLWFGDGRDYTISERFDVIENALRPDANDRNPSVAAPINTSATAGSATATSETVPTESMVGADFANLLKRLLGQQQYEEAVNLCLSLTTDLSPCRNEIIQFATRHPSLTQQIQLLTAWTSERPDDLSAGLKLVDTLIKDRRYSKAITRLQEIKNNQFAPEALAKIATFTRDLVRSSSRLFETNNDPESLVALYELLIETEPYNARWRYELSRVLNGMEQYDRAVDTLSYILFDAEFGSKATRLYNQISQRSALGAQLEIPLIQRGSQFLVETTINGQITAALLIDTGASITAIEHSVLARAGVNTATTTRGILQTVDGTTETRIVKLRSLQIGDSSIQQLDAASIRSLGDGIDGLLGMDVLGQFDFTIDQNNRVLFLELKNSG